MDGAAERGDALGDRAGVLEQVFGQHARMIAKGQGGRQPLP